MRFACRGCARAVKGPGRLCAECRAKLPPGRSTKAQDAFRRAVLERDDYTCQICGRRLPPEWLEADHVVPISEDGADHPENGRTLCRPCHGTGADPEPRPKPSAPLVAFGR